MNNISLAASTATNNAAAYSSASRTALTERIIPAQPSVFSKPRWRVIPFLFLVLILSGAGGVAKVALAAEIVNLNKADAAAMQQNLVGIGPIKAESIVSHRKKNGKFKSVDDLLNVTGIGPALLKKNKRYLSLSKGVVSGDAKKYAASKKQAKAKQSGSTVSSKSSKSPKKDSSSTKKSVAKKSSDSKTNSKSSKSKSDSQSKNSKKSSKKASSTSAKSSKSDSSKAKKSKTNKAKPAKKSSKKSSSKSKKCDKKTGKNCGTKKSKKKNASTT